MVVRCPKCGMTQMSSPACKGCGRPLDAATAPPPRPPAAGAPPPNPPAVQRAPGEAGTDPAFALDRYLFQQRLMAFSEKYDLQDERGNPVLFVERPLHALRNAAAVLAGLLVAVGLGTLIFWVAFQLPKSVQDNVPLGITIGVLGLALPVVAWIEVIGLLGQKRHISCYRDGSRQEKLLEVRQDQKLSVITPTFTVVDAQGEVLARVNKNLLTEIFRKQWVVRDPQGAVILVAKEDSILRALARRLLTNLVLLNFVLCRGESDEVIGEFNKKWSLRDRYVLDLTRDRLRRLDRRIAVAVGILLDTGERR